MAFETSTLMASVVSFLERYRLSSSVRAVGMRPFINKSKVKPYKDGSGYFQISRPCQRLVREMFGRLLSSLIQVSKASLGQLQREVRRGLRAGHCHKCSQVSFSLSHKKQFQLAL